MLVIAQMSLVVKQAHELQDIFAKICLEAVVHLFVVGDGTQKHFVPYGFVNAAAREPLTRRRVIDRT